MITLPIGDTDATILLEVLEGLLPGGVDVRRAISAAEPGAGMYLMSLTPAAAHWFHDHLVPIRRTLLEHANRSAKQRRTLRTLNRVIPMLSHRLEG